MRAGRPRVRRGIEERQCTYTLSNEPVGTTEYEDYEGTHTVYLVPDGTTITVTDDTRRIVGFIPSLDSHIYGDGTNRYTLSISNFDVPEDELKDVVFNIAGAAKNLDYIPMPDDEGIWLAIALGGTTTKPTTPVEPE